MQSGRACRGARAYVWLQHVILTVILTVTQLRLGRGAGGRGGHGGTVGGWEGHGESSNSAAHTATRVEENRRGTERRGPAKICGRNMKH